MFLYFSLFTYHTIPYIPYNTIPYNTIPYNTIPYNIIPYIPYEHRSSPSPRSSASQSCGCELMCGGTPPHAMWWAQLYTSVLLMQWSTDVMTLWSQGCAFACACACAWGMCMGHVHWACACACSCACACACAYAYARTCISTHSRAHTRSISTCTYTCELCIVR